MIASNPELRSVEIWELGADGLYARACSATSGTSGKVEPVPGCEGPVVDLDALWAEVDRLLTPRRGLCVARHVDIPVRLVLSGGDAAAAARYTYRMSAASTMARFATRRTEARDALLDASRTRSCRALPELVSLLVARGARRVWLFGSLA